MILVAIRVAIGRDQGAQMIGRCDDVASPNMIVAMMVGHPVEHLLHCKIIPKANVHATVLCASKTY